MLSQSSITVCNWKSFEWKQDLRGPKDQIRSTVFLHFFPCSRPSSWALSPRMSSSILGLMSTFFPSLKDRFSCSRVWITSARLSSRWVTSKKKKQQWLVSHWYTASTSKGGTLQSTHHVAPIQHWQEITAQVLCVAIYHYHLPDTDVIVYCWVKI